MTGKNGKIEPSARFDHEKFRSRLCDPGQVLRQKPTRKAFYKEKDIVAKLSNKFSGPCKVVRWLSPVFFRLVDSRGKYAGKEHVRHLKPYVASGDQSVGEYSGK